MIDQELNQEQTLENNQEVQEVTQENTQETPPEPAAPEATEPSKPAPAPDYLESAKERNWREVRKKAEEADKLARERDELARKLQELESGRQASPQEEDYDVRLGADELAEGKHLDKVQRKIKALEQKISQYEQRSTTMALEVKIKSEYPDFDCVVSKENIAELQAQYPELAHTLNANGDLYSKAVSAYTMIKKLGIQPDTTHIQDRVQALKNAQKPRPLTSVNPQQGDTPLSHANAFANGLTEDLKKKLWQEMQDASRS